MLYITDIDKPWVGYTQAALQYMMSLLRAQYTTWQYIPIGGTAVQWRTMPSWAEDLSKARDTSQGGYDVGFIHHTPDNVANDALRRGEKINLGFTVTETDRIPSWLAQQLNEIDGVVTATEWNAGVFREAGVTVPVHVLPHALGSYWWERPAGWRRRRSAAAPEREDYIFYYVGTWNERKNPGDVVRAYLRAFPKGDENTVLALKVGISKGQTRFLEAIVQEETGSTARLQSGGRETGDIWLYDQKWSMEEVQGFHNYGDCYVSLHRGEGWGYGLHMAVAMGKPVIYTDWSSPSEFMANAPEVLQAPVPVKDMTPAQGSNVPYFQVMPYESPLLWAQPDVDAAVAQMRDLASRRPTTTEDGLASFRDRYSWETVGAQFKDIIQGYENGV
jgi:glycosyltransferase involved in cell wall biosynthesis